jgi:hypothetical protein
LSWDVVPDQAKSGELVVPHCVQCLSHPFIATKGTVLVSHTNGILFVITCFGYFD